ncbi:ATP-binding protein [Clostridium magnum]|uniref:histidine kinase n=1 Tax=Clostridium magnum DSM 2767 TaxID=1121326 RepID=A0A162TFD6_9CLOT|nr:ATP-binding protein [Clostridium magnum]KZL92574.1 signal transduction histidine-protein kinase BaeS [Clostridium magnum DSM 2767]SHI81805.1 Signal transduction histidine kinase [Clostridium magnum DSM 2767]
MRKKLRKKLSFSYMFIIVICVLIISLLSNFFLQRLFRNYVIEQHKTRNNLIVKTIGEQYLFNGNWNIDGIKNIGEISIENGLFISVKDISGKIIWDAETYNIKKCEEVKNKVTNSMEKYFPSWEGVYTKNQYPLINNSSKIGTIEIGYYGPFFYGSNDISYIKTLNKMLLLVGVFSLLIAFIFGFLMAERLSRPILKVIDAAEMISRGNYDEKIETKTDIEEIHNLTTTINNLGTSLNGQEKLRKRLTKDISHELRTPLSTLQSHMEALIDGVWEPTSDRLKSCHEEILRLKRLVGDLEKLARYEGENLSLVITKFNLGEVINNIALNFEKQFLNKKVALAFKEDSIFVNADKDKITQVIVNLVSNALKYTEKGGKVEVNLWEEGQFAIVNVKDTGIGISNENIPHVFERFYRADESRNKQTGGSGIGLAIAKSIIKAHKGIITVESKINEGTNFTVKIPK